MINLPYSANPRRKPWRLDWLLLSAVIVLCLLGLLVLFSAAGGDTGLLIKQSIRMGIAFVVMLLLMRVSPYSLSRWSPVIYVLALILLFVVLEYGLSSKGAQRWLSLGLFRFQPAEIMKLAVPMMAAWILSKSTLPPRIGCLILVLLVALLPTVLIVLQPDLGTAILVAVTGVVMIFLAGIHWQLIATVCLMLSAAAPVLWTSVLKPYQKLRIMTMFDPWAEPDGAGYHTIQSMVAIGSGGLSGKGWFSGSQSQLDFIPERHTDFIFAVFAEEFGVFGVLVLLALYLLVVIRGLSIALEAQQTYARLLAGGLATTFFFYAFVNISMVSGILPVVGVPLPLLSYGGTSMVTLMAGFGMLMGIHHHNQTFLR